MQPPLTAARSPWGDPFLFRLCCVSALFGLLLVTSASRSGGSPRFVLVQGAALVLGILCFRFFARVDGAALAERWPLILLLNILLIGSLFVFGVDGGTGNRSWIRFPLIGIGVQPAELVKCGFLLLLARQLSRQEDVNRTRSLLFLLLHALLMCGLLLAASGDVGMTLLFLVLFLSMAFCAGLKLRWFALGAALALGGGAFAWIRGLIPDYIQNRILVVLDPELDPLGAGWQQSRSLLALGGGGLNGQGLFQGLQTQRTAESALPARHTDFLFSAAGEELGLIGCLAILLLLSLMVLHCIQIGRRAGDPFSALLCFGAAGLLGFQTAANIGMCLFLTPVIGLTLPFFSYGGSSLVTTFALMGLVAGVSARAAPA